MINDSDDVVEALKRFARCAERSTAVVVRIDSPGRRRSRRRRRSTTPIAQLREKKPVIASLGNIAASGGYYVAARCDTIVANPGTLTGSIGVIMQIAQRRRSCCRRSACTRRS